MATEDPVSQAEAIVRTHYTATRIADMLGAEISYDEPPPGSPLAELRELAARYDRGELSWGGYLAAARELTSPVEE